MHWIFCFKTNVFVKLIIFTNIQLLFLIYFIDMSNDWATICTCTIHNWISMI
jgi:hypothetical protein